MEERKQTNIYNVIILDESGSMDSIRNSALVAMNEAINGIRCNSRNFPDQNHFVTIVTFEGDGPDGVKTRRDREPIEQVKDFTEEDYRPGGCTPLYDAMGLTLTRLEGAVREDESVFATIITDGYENSSREYNCQSINILVERLKRKGWTMAYMGANQDAVLEARRMSIDNALDIDATPEGMKRMSRKYKRASEAVMFSMCDAVEFRRPVKNLFDETDEK